MKLALYLISGYLIFWLGLLYLPAPFGLELEVRTTSSLSGLGGFFIGAVLGGVQLHRKKKQDLVWRIVIGIAMIAVTIWAWFVYISLWKAGGVWESYSSEIKGYSILANGSLSFLIGFVGYFLATKEQGMPRSNGVQRKKERRPIAPAGGGLVTDASDGKRDFFVSFNQADRAWATWIAWVLEEAKYSVFFQDWDFRGSFMEQMHQASLRTERTLVVLSDNYLRSEYARSEAWAALACDPVGREDRVVTIKVSPTGDLGLFHHFAYLDLTASAEADSELLLVQRAKKSLDPTYRPKPPTRPHFPGPAATKPPFPAPAADPAPAVHPALPR